MEAANEAIKLIAKAMEILKSYEDYDHMEAVSRRILALEYLQNAIDKLA